MDRNETNVSPRDERLLDIVGMAIKKQNYREDNVIAGPFFDSDERSLYWRAARAAIDAYERCQCVDCNGTGVGIRLSNDETWPCRSCDGTGTRTSFVATIS